MGEVVTAVCLAVPLVVGVIWTAATESTHAAEMDKRISVVEKFKDTTGDKMTEMLVRLTRIETLLTEKK